MAEVQGLPSVTMKLTDYIARVGDQAAAEKFGIKPMTAKSWRLGYRRPSPEAAVRIVAATGGEVSLADIFAPPADQVA